MYTRNVTNFSYEYINLGDWELEYNDRTFEGLALNDDNNSFIDGNPNYIHWFFQIGSKNFYGGENHIPGIPFRINGKNIGCSTNDLYLRIDDVKLFNHLPIIIPQKVVFSVCHCRNTMQLSIFAIIFIELSEFAKD